MPATSDTITLNATGTPFPNASPIVLNYIGGNSWQKQIGNNYYSVVVTRPSCIIEGDLSIFNFGGILLARYIFARYAPFSGMLVDYRHDTTMGCDL